jgi:hypothetical protein
MSVQEYNEHSTKLSLTGVNQRLEAYLVHWNRSSLALPVSGVAVCRWPRNIPIPAIYESASYKRRTQVCCANAMAIISLGLWRLQC